MASLLVCSACYISYSIFVKLNSALLLNPISFSAYSDSNLSSTVPHFSVSPIILSILLPPSCILDGLFCSDGFSTASSSDRCVLISLLGSRRRAVDSIAVLGSSRLYVSAFRISPSELPLYSSLFLGSTTTWIEVLPREELTSCLVDSR